MKRLNLDNHSPFHKTGHTSKGDQRKWKVGDRWYKADYMGYESLAEVLDKEEMIMPASFIEKAEMELVGTFVKNVGLEAGKRVIYGKPQKPKENHLTEIKESERVCRDRELFLWLASFSCRYLPVRLHLHWQGLVKQLWYIR